MEKRDYIIYWTESSDHDLSSMDDIFSRAERYDWALFVGHLALEKILKALWVKNNESDVPPRTHNLLKIAEGADLELNEKDKLFLNRVNSFNLETRYPEYKKEFYLECTREFAEKNIKDIRDFHKCIRAKI